MAESKAIAAENGRRILEDPGVALGALTQSQATFTERDLARHLNTKTDGAEQFQAVFLKVKTADELVALGRDERGETRAADRELDRPTLEDIGRQQLEQQKHRLEEEKRLEQEKRQSLERRNDGPELE